MKLTYLIALLFFVLGCQSAAPKQDATSAATSSDSTTINAEVAAPKTVISCATTGKLLLKFEQNNTLFERLEDAEKASEWLKITSKDEKCAIIDGIHRTNYFSVGFEDWDNDGMRDRIDSYKWHYEVSLFDRTKNDFSRHINGDFCGEQWDFDKKQNLYYQFLEDKQGGIYELYRLVGSTKTILSQVDYTTDFEDNGAVKIQIRNNIVETKDNLKFDTLAADKQLLAAMKSNKNDDDNTHFERIKKGLKIYWQKNLPIFLR